MILISIDTCRADYLGCYGDPRPITPYIDDLARESILFEQVTASVPLTLPSHATMLTGTNPLYHGVRTNVGYRLSRAHVTLAKVLKEHGYRTGAIVSSSVLEKKYGLGQGFDSYHDQFSAPEPPFDQERRAQQTSQLAQNWLAENAHQKFFLFLHYFDPHEEYIPLEPFAATFLDPLNDF